VKGRSLKDARDTLNRRSTVTDNRLLAQGATSGVTTYNYDAVGNLQNFVYPNAVTHAYTYDALNRLTQMGSSKSQSAISNYVYTLGAAGNRTAVTELSGRNVSYGYDSLYRLTSETVSADPSNKDGAINYTYDNVGNRKTLNATLPPAGGISYTYDADDRLGSDTYDPDGNTVNSGGIANSYDFENHLITHGAVTIVYDGDGNRVSETVGGVTTNCLVDTQNPTGYAQVVDELQNGTVTRTYAYGLERIDENQILNGTWTASFYGYDRHGSVRQLTSLSGAVTDSYDYDAFGNLISSTGNTPNVYLFAGEQYDSALGLYYNRARYLNTTTGRFWSMDTDEGDDEAPLSLHKYLYAENNPVDNLDPTGNEIDEIAGAIALSLTLDTMSTVNPGPTIAAATRVLFVNLWENYPTENPCKGIENQCATRLSVALQRGGVSFRTYPGGKKPPCGILVAQELANWLGTGNPTTFSGEGKREIFTGADWRQKVDGRTGIIFFQDYWKRPTDKGGRPQAITSTSGTRIPLADLGGLPSSGSRLESRAFRGRSAMATGTAI
jgi:RHS repeat-associated protein